MGLNARKLKLALFPTIGWGVLLLLAGRFSQSHWEYKDGMAVFDVWWVAGLVFVTSSLTIFLIWRKERKISYGQWVWFVVPFVGSLFLTRAIALTLRGVGTRPASEVSMSYAIYSCAFTADVLLWIIGFPYEKILGPYSQKSRLIWLTILGAMATGITALMFQHSLSLIHGLGGNNASPYIEALQLWMEQVTAAVYVFLTARLLLPLTVSGFAAVFRPNEIS